LTLQTASVGSTAELVEFALSISQDRDPSNPLWFRGHFSSGWDLRSSLARAVETPEAMFLKEQRLLTRFRQRSLAFWPAGYPQDDWEHLFAMQHYGTPTRLLDWSENLFVGMYFACTPGAYSRLTADDRAALPSLWILDPVKWNRGLGHLRDNAETVSILTTVDEDEMRAYEVSGRVDFPRRYNAPIAIYGTHNSARIVAQRGGFTIAGKSLQSMHEFVDEVGDGCLWKVELNMDREAIAANLSALGFAESMVFPDLVGLSREIAGSEGLLG